MIWDFPCAFFIKKVRSAVILGHHAGMAATCALALHVPFCTGLFYLGVCELSTIPLQIWEGFEHAHKKAVDTSASERQVTRLAAVRDAGYTAFAPLFVAVRLLAFSWITFGCLLPDTLAVLPTAAAAGKRTALRMLCGFGVAFNALMLYWFGGAVVGMLNQPVVEGEFLLDRGLGKGTYFHHGFRPVRKSVSVHGTSVTTPLLSVMWASASDSGAGPRTTLPVWSYWDPWQGHMYLFAALFHGTTQPRCVQTALMP